AHRARRADGRARAARRFRRRRLRRPPTARDDVSERDLPAACAAIDEDLSAWLDGELDASGAAIVRDHVEGCARCAARVAALRAVDAELQALVAAEPSEAERQRLARLRARLAEEQRRLQPLPGRAVAPDEAAASGAAG